MNNWRDLFQAVVIGGDTPGLQGRITAAQEAIDGRMRELFQENIRAPQEEEQICEALQTLKLLRLKLAEHKRQSADGQACKAH